MSIPTEKTIGWWWKKMGDIIPKSVKVDRVELTPKGFLKLALAVAFVLGAIEVGRWVYGKIKGVTSKAQGELIAV